MTAQTIQQISRKIAAELALEAGALLPILHALQEHFGYVPKESIPVVAEVLNLSRAEIHGVVSFYDGFHTQVGGSKTVYICRAEACQAMGGRAVEEAAKQHLGVEFNQSTATQAVRLQSVYCLGNCACSPSVMVDDKLYSRVTPRGIIDILDNICKESS